ncbi:MAG: rhomboid family intramembrane serine protease [Bacteroidota bacterium]
MSSIQDDIKSAFRRTDNSLVQIILVNVAIFLVIGVLVKTILGLSGLTAVYQLYIRPNFALSADFKTLLFHPWTIITYFFFHENLFHILGNMLGLYWFGQLIEEYIGSKRLTAIYVLGGIISGIFFMLIYFLLPLYQTGIYNLIQSFNSNPVYAPYPFPNLEHVTLLGASGGVFAVMVAASTLLPDHAFHLMLIGRVRIVYIAAFYILISFIGLNESNLGGNIGHLAGALTGYIYIKQLRHGHDIGKPIRWVIDTVKGFFQPRPTMRVTYRNTSNSGPGGGANTRTKSVNAPIQKNGTPNQAEIDSILDKISRQGIKSLSKDEIQTLRRAGMRD